MTAEKSPAAVGLALGCLAAGRSVLIPPVTLPAATIQNLSRRAGCVATLTPEQVRPAGDGTAGAPDADAGGCPAERFSFMLTTSGSTGAPKIVPLTAGAVEAFTRWAHKRFDLGAGRRVLNYAPLNFDLCLLEVWAALRHGGCVVMAEPHRSANGRAMMRLLQRDRPHVVQAVPMLYELLLALRPAHRRPVDGVEHLIVTGDSMHPARLPALRALFPRARLYNVYGCTETNDSFLHEIAPGDHVRPAIPLGRPLPGVRAVLAGTGAGSGEVLAGPGVGELVVSTPFQSPGYLDTPSAAFGEHPVAPDGRRYFRTGDLVRRAPDGTLTLQGRRDFRVKVRGQQVDVQDVERVLLARAGVLEAAAVALPDPQAGHRLLAVVRRDAGSQLNSLELRRHCAELLPAAAIPAALHVTDEPLPRTSTGKVDRTILINAHAKVV